MAHPLSNERNKFGINYSAHWFVTSSPKQRCVYLYVHKVKIFTIFKVKIFTILWWNAFLLVRRDCSCYPVTITSSIVILLFCFPQMGFSWVINLPNLCRMHLEICSHKSNRGWKNLLPVPLECRYSQSHSDCTSVLQVPGKSMSF